MKIIYLIPILLLVSCKSFKVKVLDGSEGDSGKELIGEIKQIKQHGYHYPIKEDGTKRSDFNSELFYDKKNRLTKQVDKYSKYPKYHEVTTYRYKKNLLENLEKYFGGREDINTIEFRDFIFDNNQK